MKLTCFESFDHPYLPPTSFLMLFILRLGLCVEDFPDAERHGLDGRLLATFLAQARSGAATIVIVALLVLVDSLKDLLLALGSAKVEGPVNVDRSI